eukprot:m.31591 g.31591  ORF g.31591 m.31591 type:complete len:196 (+) comp5381_c0_seq1:98-685(+)
MTDLLALRNLFQLDRDGNHVENDLDTASPAKAAMTPAQLGVQPAPAPAPGGGAGGRSKSDTPAATKSKDIWDDDEIPDAGADAAEDPRPQPEYTIKYKQAITSEDMYLGMSGRDPSSASCEDLVVAIVFPGIRSASEIQLDVTDKFLDARTTSHRLGLHLPHPVDAKNGNAKWDKDKSMLTVTLRMRREYDFLRQ